MLQRKFVAYYRVSTEKQGRSGLGLEAQQEAVRSYLNGGSWKLMAEVVEVESGKRNDRPKLAKALRLCRLHGAVCDRRGDPARAGEQNVATAAWELSPEGLAAVDGLVSVNGLGTNWGGLLMAGAAENIS